MASGRRRLGSSQFVRLSSPCTVLRFGRAGQVRSVCQCRMYCDCPLLVAMHPAWWRESIKEPMQQNGSLRPTTSGHQ